MNILPRKQKLTQQMLETSYSIPAALRKDGALSRYYILRWSRAFFDLQPTLSKGYIVHQGQRYEIAYAPRPLYEVPLLATQKDSVILSFRCPSIELQKKGLRPVCYVTILSPSL